MRRVLSIMGEMAAGVAHELQQPLAVITNYANGCIRRLKGGDGDPESLVKTIGNVVQETMRASEIVRRIRDFVRKREVRRQWCPIASIVHDAVQLASFNCAQAECPSSVPLRRTVTGCFRRPQFR